MMMIIIIINDVGGNAYMKKISLLFLILGILFNSFLINGAYAYSYGDPNEEKVAEVYKQMMVDLEQDPPNFAKAQKQFESVKEEVDMHMGKEPGDIILDNLKDKNKKSTIENMEKLLVLNIARRLENIEKNFDNYETSKRLLAKGFATYDALSPKVEAESTENDKKIRADFDQALEALGNPGLFGVGKKEANLDVFKENKNDILNSLKSEFNLKSLEVGHFSESATEAKNDKKEWTDISNIRNWIPIILIAVLLISVIIIVKRKRK